MNFKVFMRSFFVSIGITLILLLILSILLAKTSMKENMMPIRNNIYFIN